MIVFVGKDGIVRAFKGFSRGTNRFVAVANAEDSREIVAELLRGHSRLAWIVDTEDGGLDSLEVPANSFDWAWQKLRCGTGAPK
jgi:hypothetical protein